MMIKIARVLNQLLSRRDKQVLGGLLLLSIGVSIIETFSITAIMVFISVATNFDQIVKNPYYSFVYSTLHCSSPGQFVMILGIGLVVFYVIRGALNIFHVYVMNRFAQVRYQLFITRLFKEFLLFPYQDFVCKNSATVGQVLFTYTGMLTQMITALLLLLSEVFTVTCVYAMLFLVNWKMTIVLSLLLGVKSFLIFKLFSRSIARAGKESQRVSLEISKVYNESVGNFKLIKLNTREHAMSDRFGGVTQKYGAAQTLYATLQAIPRFVLETIGFLILISIILYVIYRYNNATFVIPIVSLYALAFYRLLPSLNKILASFNQLVFAQHGAYGIHEFLQHPIELIGFQELSYNYSIKLANISFGYLPQKEVLHQASLSINKGDRVAFVGPSGAGKSTMADLIMGLYRPSDGQIIVDDQILTENNLGSWRRMIGYIPQSIYLFDGTVADNVIFGRPYDKHRLEACLQRAHIYNFLLTQQGIETRVGEGGIKLSGGQKQRIAIARALYTNPAILVLDEATSALDHEVETAVMNEIYQLDRTITMIIIAHRLTTVARCNKIYKIDQGRVELVTFESIMHKTSPVQQPQVQA